VPRPLSLSARPASGLSGLCLDAAASPLGCRYLSWSSCSVLLLAVPCVGVYPCAEYIFCGGYYCFSCGNIAVPFESLAVSFCGAVAVSTVDNILFMVYTLAKLSFSLYDRDQTLEV
jgi:hypothetical protein